jgi:pyruvate formate lyase activating enzyme
VIADYLHQREGWIEGVCITGGEPCLHEGLERLCSDLKGQGVKVKLDTNGSLPDMLEALLETGLVDYVSMDVKAPLEPGPYKIATGTDGVNLVEQVKRSIEILQTAPVEHEFRTTVVPMMHGPAEVERIAKYLSGERRFVLQHFSPRDTLDPRFAALRPFTDEDMQTMVKQARIYVPGTVVRGAPAPII